MWVNLPGTLLCMSYIERGDIVMNSVHSTNSQFMAVVVKARCHLLGFSFSFNGLLPI